MASADLASAGPASPTNGGRPPYVVNGAPATIEQFPFLVAILNREIADPFTAQFCGGSVVAPTIVLTAAHCVDDRPASALDVLANTTDLAIGEGERVAVASVAVHPLWNSDTNQNDLALLHLDDPVSAVVIDVAPPGYEATWQPSTIAATAGWGCTQVHPGGLCVTGGFPDSLFAGSVTLRDDRTCRVALAPYFDANTMRCAGASSSDRAATDACEGDSGGPLRVQRSGLPPILVGVVSWGFVCGSDPGVYTRIERYRSWLRSQGVPVAANGFVGQPTQNVTAAYDRAFVCDINGDGVDDQFLYATGGAPDAIRLGTRQFGLVAGPPVNVGSLYVPVAGDYDDDGRCDILWYRPGPASETLWRSSASGYTRTDVPSVDGSYQPVVTDVDNDDHDDIIWYDATNGSAQVWSGRRTRFVVGPVVAAPVDAALVAGDLDGDGHGDLYFDLPTPSADVTWRGDDAGFSVVVGAVTIPSAGPLFVGDFDGDGRADVFRDVVSGRDEFWHGGDAGLTGRKHPRQIGSPRPGLVGDFDGDGHHDIFWYRAGSGIDIWWRGA